MANKVTLLGRLGKDPELTFTASGLALCKFSLATSESWTDKASGDKMEKVEWHNVVAFGKTGETIGKFLTKGQQAYIEGKIHYNKYQDKEGNNRISTEIQVDKFEFVGSKNDGGKQGQGGAAKPKDSQLPIVEDDVPF